MAGRIVREDVETLRAQADIVAVVGDYTQLRRAGKSWKGLCPFHTERTPSFTCTPEGNFFHCFGCGASGDVFDFLQRVEGLDFPESVEALARRTGFPLRYEQRSVRDREAVGERSRLVEVTRRAMEHYTRRLLGEEGVAARAYLKERGFGRSEADAFSIGYATEAWDDLSRALTGAGVAAEDLLKVGLSVRNDRGGLRDRFRARIVFPIMDARGDVIGFGGRILPGVDHGDFEPPKYLNSPETPLYRKSRVLYGVPQARAAIVAAQRVLVCEGYTDVIALHQAGFANAVATCGTAVGAEHLRALARYAPEVVLAFDADRAGIQAAERAWEAAREVAVGGSAALRLSVLPLPEGRDPADLAREGGASAVEAAVAGAQPVVPFLLRARLADADLTTDAGRAAGLRAALEVLGREADADLRRVWARDEIARPLGIAYDFVVATAARVGVRLDAVAGVAAVRRDPGARGAVAVDPRLAATAEARLERSVLRAVLQVPALLPSAIAEVEAGTFRHPAARSVWEAVVAAGGPGAGVEAVAAAAADDEVRALVRAIALEEDPADGSEAALRQEAVHDVVHGLLVRDLADGERALRERLAAADAAGDATDRVAALRELQALGQRRRALRGAGGGTGAGSGVADAGGA